MNPKIPSAAYFHQSATVVVRDTSKGGKSYLAGQDEQIYFGCELQDHPQTVQNGFVSLTPKAARMQSYQRQGEWFLVATKEKEVPSVDKAVILFGHERVGMANQIEGDVALPKDSDDSANHWINCKEGRVDKDGVIYARDGVICHENGDHKDVKWSGWVSFRHNTAVRSFSEEGVD